MYTPNIQSNTGFSNLEVNEIGSSQIVFLLTKFNCKLNVATWMVWVVEFSFGQSLFFQKFSTTAAGIALQPVDVLQNCNTRLPPIVNDVHLFMRYSTLIMILNVVPFISNTIFNSLIIQSISECVLTNSKMWWRYRMERPVNFSYVYYTTLGYEQKVQGSDVEVVQCIACGCYQTRELQLLDQGLLIGLINRPVQSQTSLVTEG